MVWIQIYDEIGVINDEMIEKICPDTPKQYKEWFKFYAYINGEPYLIHSEDLPRRINETIQITAEIVPNCKTDFNEKQEAYEEAFKNAYSEIYDEERKIFSKIMSVLFRGKENRQQPDH